MPKRFAIRTAHTAKRCASCYLFKIFKTWIMKLAFILIMLLTLNNFIKGQNKCYIPDPIPIDISDCINKGNYLYYNGKFAECASNYDSLILKYPNYCVAYYQRGLARYYNGDISGATLDLEYAYNLGFTKALDFISEHNIKSKDKNVNENITDRTKILDEERKRLDEKYQKRIEEENQLSEESKKRNEEFQKRKEEDNQNKIGELNKLAEKNLIGLWNCHDNKTNADVLITFQKDGSLKLVGESVWEVNYVVGSLPNWNTYKQSTSQGPFNHWDFKLTESDDIGLEIYGRNQAKFTMDKWNGTPSSLKYFNFCSNDRGAWDCSYEIVGAFFDGRNFTLDGFTCHKKE
jgi:hypothetical protein